MEDDKPLSKQEQEALFAEWREDYAAARERDRSADTYDFEHFMDQPLSSKLRRELERIERERGGRNLSLAELKERAANQPLQQETKDRGIER